MHLAAREIDTGDVGDVVGNPEVGLALLGSFAGSGKIKICGKDTDDVVDHVIQREGSAEDAGVPAEM